MNRVNAYKCQKCGQIILTRDVDEGVTPFMVPCLATIGCKGPMYSAFYKPPEFLLKVMEPTYEWFKPIGKDYEALEPAMKAHVDQGGLDLRHIETQKVVR